MENKKESYSEILAQLSEDLGIELAFDDDNCNLYLDDDNCSFTIRKFEDEGRIVLMGIIAEDLPEDISYSLVTELLDNAMNPLYKAGPAIARDAESGMIVAYVSVDLKDIVPKDMLQIVEQFVAFQVHYAEVFIEEATEGGNNSNPTEENPLTTTGLNFTRA
ncbi:MAG: type III secretion system chaperone [Succinivibrio sp.]|nr:type III secretion system chaperone [Succinivibrio sp.]